MMFPSNRVRIVVATKPVDFRKGHDGLAALVKNELRKEPFIQSGHYRTLSMHGRAGRPDAYSTTGDAHIHHLTAKPPIRLTSTR